ncbi:MAG TPA: hypothetical protein VHO01_14060 [Jatrophihabitans sp.]|nr:hypothetical protein [Jatrophihabitans sp.]
MRRARLAIVARVAGLTLLVSSCSASSVTSAKLDAAIGPTFVRLYAQQQRLLGHQQVAGPDGSAQCSRTNTTSPHRGAGDDWVCVLNFPYADGHVQPVYYDVKVTPTGCYTAAGPAQLVGQQTERAADGHLATNPLFEFDGCFAI